MTGKGLNLFDECAAECVHWRPQEEGCTSFALGYGKIYTPDIIANSKTDTTPTNGAVVKVRVLVELGIL